MQAAYLVGGSGLILSALAGFIWARIQKRKLKSFAATVQMFTKLLESANDAIISIDEKSLVRYFNPSAERMFGRLSREIIGQPLAELLPERFRASHDAGLKRFLSTGEARVMGRTVELHGLRQNGEEFPLELSISHCRTETGVFFTGIVRDIQDRKKLEEDRERFVSLIQNQRAQLDKAQQIAHIGNWTLDIPTLSLSWSDETYRIYGLDPKRDKISLEWARSLAHPEFDQVNRDLRKKALENRSSYALDYKIIRPSGEVRDVHGDAEVILDAKGLPHQVFGIIQDVTETRAFEKELVKAREEALEASRMKSQFLANMSHEIRTPINGIMGMTSLLLDTELNAEQRDFAETIRTSADALLLIVNDILDFSKIEAGKLELEAVSFSIEELLADLEKTFTYIAQAKQLSYKQIVELEKGRSYHGDPGRMRQVLSNLLSNAFKFTKKGEVCLSVKTLGDGWLRFAVKDTGIGIPPDVLGRLFQPFTQADASTTRKFGGTGLGLSISKQLTGLMGGRMGAESTPAQGSTFWFELSLEEAEVPAKLSKASEATTATQSPSSEISILVAEDNLINQKIAKATLEKFGYRVEICPNGHEAIAALENGRFDLVLMDCQMPEMDGYEATRCIRARADAGFRNIPIIAMTANALNGDREKCLEAGMSDYVSKPIKSEDLAAVIRKWHPGRGPTQSGAA